MSHGSSEWERERLLVDIPPIEKVERVVLMVRESSHVCVDFLTVWRSIGKSSKTLPVPALVCPFTQAHTQMCGTSKLGACPRSSH